MQAIEALLSKHRDLFDTVKVWDNDGLTMDRYAILIENDLWFMSTYPAYPNGVCMYGGEYSGDYENVYLGELIALDELPTTVLKQIIVLAKEKTCLPQ